MGCKIDKPGNKRKRHSSQKFETGQESAFPILQCQKGKENAHHPGKVEAQINKLDIGYHPRQEATQNNFLGTHGFSHRIVFFEISYNHVQTICQNGEHHFFRGATPVKSIGGNHGCIYTGSQHQCSTFLCVQANDFVEGIHGKSAFHNFQNKHACICAVGNEISQTIEEIQPNSLLIKNVSVRHITIHQGFSHGKITIGVIPVITYIEKG